MWLGVVSASILAILVLFWAVARRVKFFTEESFNRRLKVFPSRFKYEMDVIATELKTLLNVLSPNIDKKAPVDDTKWLDEDDEFLKEIARDTQCPFPVFSVLNEIGEVDEDFEVPKDASTEPYILRGYMDSWSAMRSERWQRYKLLKSYGRKAISSNSQAGIVFGGGRANMKFKSLGRVLREMRQHHDDIFTFDSDILNSIPELRNDFEVPEIFSGWSNSQSESEGYCVAYAESRRKSNRSAISYPWRDMAWSSVWQENVVFLSSWYRPTSSFTAALKPLELCITMGSFDSALPKKTSIRAHSQFKSLS